VGDYMPVNGNSYNIGRRYEGPNDLVAALDTERSRKAFRQRIKMRESRALELREELEVLKNKKKGNKKC
jgi:hypothetical protein